MAKPTRQKPIIEVTTEALDQYDYFDEDIMERKEARYASSIGKFLIRHSALEHCLDIELAEIISDRAHDKGYIVIRNLEFSQKIEIFYNLLKPVVASSDKNRQQRLDKLNSIRDELESLSVLRNKVAHAKWYTLDKAGYVRVDTKPDKDSGFINFRKFKITPSVMRSGMRRMEVLANQITNFTERIWD